MTFLKNKFKYIAFGLCMGAVAAGINMFNLSRGSEAAVLVMDDKNIAQAVEEVIRTTKILTTEQQNLLIQMIQSKKFDSNILAQMMKTSNDNRGFMSDCVGSYRGILNKNTSTDSYLRSQIGMVEDVFNGNITVYDAYKKWESSIKAREQAALDAASTAKTSQIVARNASKGSAEALANSQNAEGLNQLYQAGNALQANHNDITAAQLQVDSQMLALMAEKTQQENMEKAMREQYRRDCLEALSSYDWSYVAEGNKRNWR